LRLAEGLLFRISQRQTGLARLSQFEAVFGYFETEIANKPNALNNAISKSVVVKTYPLS
jgi:hypothetical protein